MVVKTDAGRALEAKAVVTEFLADKNSFVFGMATGVDWWGEEQFENATFVDDKITLSRPVARPLVVGEGVPLVVKSLDGETVYSNGVDYEIDAEVGVLTRRELGSIPEGGEVQLKYTADIPAPTTNQDELLSLTGFIPLVGMDYVLPASEVDDPNATTIQIQGEKYVIVNHPTRLLLARGVLPESEGVGDPIKAYGLYRGAKLKSGLEAGKQFFVPADFEVLGTLTHAKHRSGVVHDGTLSFNVNILLQY